MTKVHLMFDTSDWALAKQLSENLGHLGHDVTWNDELRPESADDERLLHQIAEASAVIVIWTANSVRSEVVSAHADIATRHGKLIPLRLSSLPVTHIPERFRMQHIDEFEDFAEIHTAVLQFDGAHDTAATTSAGSIFVSYARSDWAVAEALVKVLESRGFDVWWDRELVAGHDFQEQIKARLDAASAVIAIWSESGVRSGWVMGEATRAKRSQKLISTYMPDFRAMEIPAALRTDQPRRVDDLNAILAELARVEVQPRQTAAIPTPLPDNSVADAFKSMREAAAAQVSYFLPLVVLVATVGLGLGFIVIADGIKIAIVPWQPRGAEQAGFVKEVGYNWALNWSLTSVIILPMAWALVLLVLEKLGDYRQQLVTRRMIVTTHFEPILDNDSRLQRLRRDVTRMTIAMIASVVGFIMLFTMWDFHNVVTDLYLNENLAKEINVIGTNAKIALADPTLERDWSVATFLDRTNNLTINQSANWWFGLLVHIIYPGIGVGALFAYFLVLIGIGAFLMPSAMSRYGLQILPDLDSDDHRRGFEVFSSLFSNSLAISALCFCCSYLMLTQNVYLRVEAASLVEFLTPNVTAGMAHLQSGNYADAVRVLLGNTFAKETPYGAIASVLSWFVFMFMFLAMFGCAYLFLRASAQRGRERLWQDINRHGMGGLLKVTDRSKEDVLARLSSMDIWPVGWPRLNLVLASFLASMLSLIFYKLGFFFMIIAIVFALYQVSRTVE